MKPVVPRMPDRLVAHLEKGAPALLLTAGPDGYPSSSYTWAVALGPDVVRFAVDDVGTALDNLQRSGLAGLHVIGPDDLAFLVKGTCRQLKGRLEAASPAALRLWELRVAGARDQSFPGVTATPFTYEWPAERRERQLRMEQAVFEEMRRA